jgi:diguanylate cyclase (GGDEF)-like protein
MSITTTAPIPTTNPTTENIGTDEDLALKPGPDKMVAPRPKLGILLLAMCALVTALAVCWVGRLLIVGKSTDLSWTMQYLLASATLCIVVFIALAQIWFWRRPMVRLIDMLPQLRSGEAPISDLSKIHGGLEPLIPHIENLLCDIKRNRANVATLNEEMKQKIANRTDALERKIGSLQQQATRDGLTGLFNRRMLDREMPGLLTKCRAERVELCVLMMDIDHFKPLNDTLGHDAGDAFLQQLSALIRSTIKDTDMAFRNGGDEFVILMPGRRLYQVRECAERLSMLVDHLARTVKVVRPPRLSIGMASSSDYPESDAFGLLKQADKDLYDQKAVRKAGANPLNTRPATLQSSASK